MTRHVYIVGTSHSLQCGEGEDQHVQLFTHGIRRVLDTRGIERIAEEMSCDALRARNLSTTLCERIAEPRNIRVQHVDLGEEDRERLSLSGVDRVNFLLDESYGRGQEERHQGFEGICGEVRERVWVARVLAGREWPVLFVCGTCHVDAVRELFVRVGVEATVECRDFDPSEGSVTIC